MSDELPMSDILTDAPGAHLQPSKRKSRGLAFALTFAGGFICGGTALLTWALQTWSVALQ